MSRLWKVGELATRTGLTVRTLHHYDAVGLLSPSARTDALHGAGHRLYTAADVERLQRIVTLKALGFTLEQIRDALGRGDFEPREVLRLQLEHARRQLHEQKALCEKLERLAVALDAAGGTSAEEFLDTIEAVTMFEKYYTPEQLEYLKQRREQVGEARIKEVEAEWPRLMAAVRAEMEKGTDPTDPAVRALAAKWKALVEEFTGGDPGVAKSLGTMYASEDRVHGMDVASLRPMFEYIRKAMG